MAVIERENSLDVSTELVGAGDSQATQSNPATRRLALDLVSAELETLAIERNREFHSTILARIAVDAPLVDADDIL